MASATFSRTELAALVALLLAAAFLRLHALGHVPPGLTHDEAAHARDAARILEGIRPLYFTIGYGREPLYDYSTAPVMFAVGPRGYASRLTAAFYGLLLIPLTWAWARRALGPAAALTAAGLLAVGFWPVMTARQALRSITLPVLLAAAVYWWWREMDKKPLTAGVLLGLSLYTYLAARVMWAIFPAMLVYLALRRREVFARVWRPTVVMLLVTAAVSAPLFGWLLAHPGAETRIGDLSYPLDQARAGNWEPMRVNAGETLGMFAIRGDGLWVYNLPGRPLLAPLQGILCLLGAALALAAALRGQMAAAFLLIWVLAGMAPNLVTGVDASTTRAIGLMPALYVLAGWAFAALWRDRRAGMPLAALLIALTGLTTYREYFDLWAPARDVRVAYHHTLMKTIDYLEHSPDASPVMLSSITPEAVHDPAIVRAALRRDDLRLRWFDARGALLFPDEEAVRVTLPKITPLEAALMPYFTGAEHTTRLALRPDDFNRVVDIYTWRPREALAAALPALHRAATPLPDPGAALEQPVLELLGYTYAAPDALVAFWRVLRPYGARDTDGVKLFVHSTTDQDDRLDAPAWAWQPGDAFAQVHRVALDGADAIYVGAYDRDTGVRLTVAVGDALGHRLHLDEGKE